MQQYYEAELRKLRESALHFAKRHPEQAQMLGLQSLRDRDPYIERLLEGTAYLTAKLQQRIDDDIPELSASLLEQLCPQLLRHIPALTIAEFSYRPGQLQQGYKITKHAQIYSDSVGNNEEKTPCYFRTTHPVTLLPLNISDVNSVELETGGTRLKFTFVCDQGVSLDSLSFAELPLYLHADPVIALHLRMALVSQVKHVHLRYLESQHPVFLGRQDCIMANNLSVKDNLLPTSDRSFPGHHLLQDYFSLREKYYFVNLTKFAEIKWPQGVQQFTLEVDLDTLFPKEYHIHKEMFKLYCTPAINLFQQDSEPFIKTSYRHEYPVIADANLPTAVKLFSLDEVIGLDERAAKQQVYTSMASFLHRENNASCYQLRYVDEGDEVLASHLTFSAATDPDMQQTMSCAITASNGHYPRRYLHAQTIQYTGAQLPNYIKVTNLTRPTAMLEMQHQTGLQWSLLASLSLNHHTLTELTHLRSVLSLYDWSGRNDNLQRIQAISELQVKPIRQIFRGAMQQGLELEIILQESGFESIADAHLFGQLLHEFFCQYVTINYFIKTNITCHPSNREFQWQTHHGQNIPL